MNGNGSWAVKNFSARCYTIAYTNPSGFLNCWMDGLSQMQRGKLVLQLQQAMDPDEGIIVNHNWKYLEHLIHSWSRVFWELELCKFLFCSPASIEGFREKIKACLTAKGVAYNHSVGGCQLTKLISMWNICSVQDFSNILALYFICFGLSFLKESRICLCTRDVLFIKPWREYQMTFLFYLQLSSMNFIRKNTIPLNLP
jgi:hypothetical protein